MYHFCPGVEEKPLWYNITPVATTPHFQRAVRGIGSSEPLRRDPEMGSGAAAGRQPQPVNAASRRTDNILLAGVALAVSAFVFIGSLIGARVTTNDWDKAGLEFSAICGGAMVIFAFSALIIVLL